MSIHKIWDIWWDDNAKFEARMEAWKVAVKNRIDANARSLENDEFKFEARIYWEQMLKVIEEILTGKNALKDKLPKLLVEELSKFSANNNSFNKEETEKLISMLRDYFLGEDQEINPMLEKEVKQLTQKPK